jgi:hypothetical protein
MKWINYFSDVSCALQMQHIWLQSSVTWAQRNYWTFCDWVLAVWKWIWFCGWYYIYNIPRTQNRTQKRATPETDMYSDAWFFFHLTELGFITFQVTNMLLIDTNNLVPVVKRHFMQICTRFSSVTGYEVLCPTGLDIISYKKFKFYCL